MIGCLARPFFFYVWSFFFGVFFGQPFSVSYFFFLETGIYIFFHFGSFNEHISRAVGVVNEQKKNTRRKCREEKKKKVERRKNRLVVSWSSGGGTATNKKRARGSRQKKLRINEKYSTRLAAEQKKIRKGNPWKLFFEKKTVKM